MDNEFQEFEMEGTENYGYSGKCVKAFVNSDDFGATIDLREDAQITNPLEASIEKWELIVFLLRKGIEEVHDGGAGSCALCDKYLVYPSTEDHPDKIRRHATCDGCPVQERTGFHACVNTPYDEYTDHDDLQPQDALDAAVNELIFLRSLRPTVEQKSFLQTQGD